MTNTKESKEYKDYARRLSFGIKDYVDKSGKSGVVLGLSGGVDSALVAKLCKDALGAKNVLCVIMPCGPKDQPATRDATKITKHLGLKGIIQIDINKSLAYLLCYLSANAVIYGNAKARLRMTVLYAIASRFDCLVAGTGNRSELEVGYFTKYGDGGCDFLPIGNLYKTQVWKMARAVGLPEWVIRKKPTAGLWPGQTDEGELGISYKKLDIILDMFHNMLVWNLKDISKKAKVTVKEVRRIRDMKKASEHKRCLPRVIY